ncbi:MAG: MATE family efflux transporter, partial [Nostoc sp.]
VNFTQNDLFNFQILNLLIPIMPIIGFTGNLFIYTGKEKIVAAVLLFKSLLIFVPLVFLFSRLLGVNGIYYGIIATNILFVLIVILLTVKEFKFLEQMEVEKMTG